MEQDKVYILVAYIESVLIVQPFLSRESALEDVHMRAREISGDLIAAQTLDGIFTNTEENTYVIIQRKLKGY